MATVFSIDNIGFPKAIDVEKDPRCPIDPCWKPYPPENYLSGDGMSKIWTGKMYYNPKDLSWQKEHERRALPRERISGQLTFENEDLWRKWQKKRDVPNSKHCGGLGYRMCDIPGLKLNGHAFSPFNLYRAGAQPLNPRDNLDPLPPRDDPNFPVAKRTPLGFYGYYHNELDIHNNGGFRLTRRIPSDPCACKGSVLMY